MKNQISMSSDLKIQLITAAIIVAIQLLARWYNSPIIFLVLLALIYCAGLIFITVEFLKMFISEEAITKIHTDSEYDGIYSGWAVGVFFAFNACWPAIILDLALPILREKFLVKRIGIKRAALIDAILSIVLIVWIMLWPWL